MNRMGGLQAHENLPESRLNIASGKDIRIGKG